jgi:hypothetical protein
MVFSGIIFVPNFCQTVFFDGERDGKTSHHKSKLLSKTMNVLIY